MEREPVRPEGHTMASLLHPRETFLSPGLNSALPEKGIIEPSELDRTILEVFSNCNQCQVLLFLENISPDKKQEVVGSLHLITR